MIPLYEVPRIGKFIRKKEKKKRQPGAGWGKQDGVFV